MPRTLILNRYTSRDEPPIVRLESTGGPVRDGAVSDAPNIFASGVSFAALNGAVMSRMQVFELVKYDYRALLEDGQEWCGGVGG